MSSQRPTEMYLMQLLQIPQLRKTNEQKIKETETKRKENPTMIAGKQDAKKPGESVHVKESQTEHSPGSVHNNSCGDCERSSDHSKKSRSGHN